METSLFLAKFWGWYLILFFFILSFNPGRIKQIFTFLKDAKFVILVSFLAIIIGLLNILFHNIWEADWRFIITAIGWVALFEGVTLFIFPERIIKIMEYLNMKLIQVTYVLLFICGLFLLNMGYAIIPY
ncbi:MAG: hypothetical protein CVU03_00795 [Bacteroidetes bacterium HGW-Bacteroidetes-2]|jgi:uncharacterized protein YjeT (DUF2065 family)|nr:MAG: hypothetical protein CVU03_00795 [Bacteroidetes bacterium HGW-Bacteroidetes-2]